ncbi:MAG: TIGR03435 family protein [Candidatus Sulfopaludibacter sp.]|nr:TIGR03435 family protein [Candidatus Sulfopaludibacter sp.]
MKTFLLFLIAVPATCIENAQDVPIQPKFEVASVKRTDRCFAGNSSIDPGSVTLKGVPLKGVLMEAFQVKMEQIEGPSWLETDCFEISAKMPEGATKDQLPAMLQALMTERFKLAAHQEARPRSGYALVVDKGGPKVKEDDPKTNFMRSPDGRQLWAFGASGHGLLKGVMTMATLASNLSRQGYGPVQDATGLTGKYDIDLTWAPDPAFAPRDPAASAATLPGADIPAPEGPSLFTALRESLGLRMERRDVRVQFVVIDHIERIPTEN